MSTKVAGCSEKVMRDLWRAVVLAEWGNGCALHGMASIECRGDIQCHHIKRRGIKPLKYAPTNGIPLCEAHHGQAGYRYVRTLIEGLVGADKMEWLDGMERKLLPDFLAERGQTRKEWLTEHKAYLQALVKGGA